MKMTPNIIGLFLTNSSDAVKRAWFYCRYALQQINFLYVRTIKYQKCCLSCKLRVCHQNLEKIEDLKRCKCKKLAKARFDYFNDSPENNTNQKQYSFLQQKSRHPPSENNHLRQRRGQSSASADESDEEGRKETAKMKFDSTGSFHWTPARQLSDVILTRQVRHLQ